MGSILFSGGLSGKTYCTNAGHISIVPGRLEAVNVKTDDSRNGRAALKNHNPTTQVIKVDRMLHNLETIKRINPIFVTKVPIQQAPDFLMWQSLLMIHPIHFSCVFIYCLLS